MQHPKKIIRTTKVTTYSTKQQESTQNVRRVDRRSPSAISQQKQRASQSMDKSSCSLQLSKSSNESPIIKNLSKLSKHDSIELTLHEQELKVQKELNDLKKMQLSPKLRDSLFKLQRYDKNFMKESEKQLKEVLEQQMQRLEGIRAQDKQLAVNLYDTELLVRCLLNHRVLLSEVQKMHSDQIQQLWKSKSDIEDKSSILSRSSSRQRMNLSFQDQFSPTRKGLGSQRELSKQLQTGINFSIRALANRQYPQAKLEITKFVQKAKKERGYDLYLRMMNEMESLASDLEEAEKVIHNFEEENSKLTKNLEFSNKYVRENKWYDLQRLNLKLGETKGTKPQITLSLLIESVIQNNKQKTREMNSRSRQKMPSTSPERLKNGEIENLKKELAKMEQELAEERRKYQTLIQERNTQRIELNKLRSSMNIVDKERMAQSLKQPEQKSSNNNREINRLQEQKRSLQSKARSLEHSKKTQEQKLIMLQKKAKSLQLSLSSSNQQLKETLHKLSVSQKQLNQTLSKLKLLQQNQNPTTTPPNSSSSNTTPLKIPMQQLRSLQNDFNELSRQKQEEECNYVKMIEEKDRKIMELEGRLGCVDSFGVGSGAECGELVRMELEEKDKELLKLKKQLIESLQGKSIVEVKGSSLNTQKTTPSILQSLFAQILQIHALKQQQTLSQGFSLQLNNIQRQQWRQVSKKLKQYKKRHPQNKSISYLQQKHRHEFELTEKLTDYQEKMLAIHNELYRVKSIICGQEGRAASGQKGGSNRQGVKEEEKWWRNVEVIHVKERTEFAKLFNELIDELCKSYNSHEAKRDNQLIKSDIKTPMTGQVTESNSKHTDQEYQKVVQQKKSILSQIQSVQKIIKQLTAHLTSPEKTQTIIFTNPQHLRKYMSQLKPSPHLPTLATSVTNLSNSYSHLLNLRQIHHTKLHSELASLNKTLSQSLSSRERELGEMRQRYQQIDKEKKVIEKNLVYKTKEVEEKELLKDRVIQLEQTVKKYTCYKEIIEEEERIVEYFIEESMKTRSESSQQEPKESKASELTQSKSNVSSSKSSYPPSASKDLTSSFKKKYQQNSKTVEYLQKLKGELEHERKTNEESKYLMESVRVVIGEFLEVLKVEEDTVDYSQKLAQLTKKNSRLEELNIYMKKKYPLTYTSSSNRKKSTESQPSVTESPHLDKQLSEQLTILQKSLIQFMKRSSQTFQQKAQLSKKLSTTQLTNQQITRQMQELNEMERIFKFIMEKKIMGSKQQSLPHLVESEASITKNPQIIREIYHAELNRKMKQKLSPISMLKKKSTNTPTESLSEYSLSNFSLKTSRIEEHSNPIIETVFRLFSKINQMHIQYEDSILQKFEQSRIKIIDNNTSLKEMNEELKKEVKELKERVKTYETNNKVAMSNESVLVNVQSQAEELREKVKGLEKEKRQLQAVNKKLDVVKKEFEDERVLIEKYMSVTSNNNSNNNSSLVYARSSSASKQQRSGSKQLIVTSSLQQKKPQLDQKKQLLAFKRLYPKSRLIAYIQLMNKKLTTTESRQSMLQTEKQSVISYYNSLVERMEAGPLEWYKNGEVMKGLLVQSRVQRGNNNNNSNGSSELMVIVREFTKQVIQNKKQLDALSANSLLLTTKNEQLQKQLKQLQSLSSSLPLLDQVLQSLHKSLQVKFSSNSKQKEELFTNEFYLKNLFESQVKKRKNLASSLESLTSLVSKVFYQISVQSSTRQTKKLQELSSLKARINKQKEQLNQRILQLTLKNKQLQVTNKQLLTENKLIKESLKKLQSSVSYLEDTNKSVQTNQKSKEYQILRLRETIENYVTQETSLELKINRLQKDKKEMERQNEKMKKQVEKLKEQRSDFNQQIAALNRLIETLKQQQGQKDNSLSENQNLFNNLKTNYSRTEKQLQSIEARIAQLLQEKTQLQEELNKLKQDTRKEKMALEKQLNAKRLSLQNLQKTTNKQQKDNVQLNLKIKHLESTHQMEMTHQQSLTQHLQQQLKQSTSRQKRERDELNKRIDSLVQERNSIMEREQQQVQMLRQKLVEVEIQKEKSKSTEVMSFSREVDELNKSYAQMIKSYQKEKLSLREQSLKAANQYETTIKRLQQQNSDTLLKYERQLSELKNSSFIEAKHLNDQLLSIKQENQHFRENLTMKEKQLEKSSQERHVLGMRLVEAENLGKELEHRLMLCEGRLNESEKSCVRLAGFERKTMHYEAILLMNNIALSEESSNSNSNSKNSINRPPQSHFQNTLQTRLQQIQSLKQHTHSLQQKLMTLTIQLQKQLSQKQFIKQQSQLNRQDYIKICAQSKEELRHLRQENKILLYEKNLFENQLAHYRETIKQMNERNHVLEEQVRNGRVGFERELIGVRDSAERECVAQVEAKDKIISEKSHALNSLESQIAILKQKLHSLDQSNRNKQIQFIQLESRLKQTQLKSKNDKEKHQILFSSEKAQLLQQINLLKDNLSKAKFQLEIATKDLAFFKASLEQKSKQASSLKFELQSLEKFSALQKSNYEAKIRQIEHNMTKLQQRMEENSRIQYHQRITLETKQSTEIKTLKNELSSKSFEYESLINQFRSLENIHKGKEVQINGLRKCLNQLEIKLDEKMRQISRLNKQNLDLDMKIKQIQRTSKFQTLELKAQLDFNLRIRTELQEKCQSLELQLEEGRTPFSPSTTIKYEAKQSTSQMIENLQNENFMLKKNIESSRQKYHEIQNHLSHSKSRILQLSGVGQECNHLRRMTHSLEQQLSSTKSSLDQALSKTRELEHSKSLLQQQLQQLHTQHLKLVQSSCFESEKSRNSQRVLDHQLIEYKSKLQNVQQCLKEEREKNYKYKMEIEKFRRERIEDQLSSQRSFRSSQVFDSQTERLRLQNHQLQKRLIAKNFEISQLKQNEHGKISSIEHLQREISKLKYENQRIFFSHQSNLQFINSSNKKLHELFSILQNQFSYNSNHEFGNQAQFDLILEVSNKIYQLLEENKSLKNQCRTLQQKMSVWAFSSEKQFKNDQSAAFQLESLVENLIGYAVLHNLIDDSIIDSKLSDPFESAGLEGLFGKAQKRLKQLISGISSQNTQTDLVERYEWSIQRIKKLIRQYIEKRDSGALQSLKEIAHS